jgi:hypothetical protein
MLPLSSGERAMANGFFGPLIAHNASVPELWGPMLKVGFSDSLDPNRRHIVANDIVASVDTGAEMCAIDDSFARSSRLSPDPNDVLKTHTATGVATLPVYRGQVIIDSKTIQLRFVGADFAGAVHKITLGMDALRFFDLHLSRRVGTVSLQFVPE